MNRCWVSLVLRVLLPLGLITAAFCDSHSSSDAQAHCSVTVEKLLAREASCGSRQLCSCPDGFIPCGRACYQRLNVPATHAQARVLCRKLHPHSHLAVPRTRHQNLCAAGLAGNRPIWLGVTDLQQEGLFVGDDGAGVVDMEGAAHVWSPGQPDNFQGAEDCVEMWLGQGFAEWNDRHCDHGANLPMCQLG